MGTNYFIKSDAGSACACCGHTPPSQEVHLGKSSGGWAFLFKGNRDPENGPLVTTEQEWWAELQRRVHAGQFVWDEYGDIISLPELRKVIDSTRQGRPHTQLVTAAHSSAWQDEEGNSFMESEFS